MTTHERESGSGCRSAGLGQYPTSRASVLVVQYRHTMIAQNLASAETHDCNAVEGVSSSKLNIRHIHVEVEGMVQVVVVFKLRIRAVRGQAGHG